MSWRDLAALDCGLSAATESIDPKLLWVMETEGAKGTPPSGLSILVELTGKTDADWELARMRLREFADVPAAYVRSRYCTARVPSPLLHRLVEDAKSRTGTVAPVAARVCAQSPILPLRPRPEPAGPAGGARGQTEKSRQRTLIGLIDIGCPFAHLALRKAGALSTRVCDIWIQDQSYGPQAASAGTIPEKFGYGLQLTRAALDKAMASRTSNGVVDEAAVYSDLGLHSLFERASHGSAVLDLFAGALQDRVRVVGAAPHEGRDEAAEADIAFVQLPEAVIQDTSGAGSDAFILDAILYILSCAGPETKSVVINISYGSRRGSQDGQSIIERAISDLVRHHDGIDGRKKLYVAIPAGNAFSERCHALVRCDEPDTWYEVSLRMPPSNETPTQVVLRIPRSLCGQLTISVMPPGSDAQAGDDPTSHVSAGNARSLWRDGFIECGVIFPAIGNVADSCEGLIFFAPTQDFDPDGAQARSGTWRIALKRTRSSRRKNDRTGAIEPVRLFALKNQTVMGAFPRSQQPRFLDVSEGRDYDPDRHARAAEDDPEHLPKPPVPAVRILRRGTLNTLAAGPIDRSLKGRLVVVGSAYLSGQAKAKPAPTWYSSDGLPRSVSHLSAREKPDRYAATELCRSIGGILSAGNLSGQRVRVRGTSFAAPQIARDIVNSLASRSRKDPSEANPSEIDVGPRERKK